LSAFLGCWYGCKGETLPTSWEFKNKGSTAAKEKFSFGKRDLSINIAKSITEEELNSQIDEFDINLNRSVTTSLNIEVSQSANNGVTVKGSVKYYELFFLYDKFDKDTLLTLTTVGKAVDFFNDICAGHSDFSKFIWFSDDKLMDLTNFDDQINPTNEAITIDSKSSTARARSSTLYAHFCKESSDWYISKPKTVFALLAYTNIKNGFIEQGERNVTTDATNVKIRWKELPTLNLNWI
jgi:hypothetical protein